MPDATDGVAVHIDQSLSERLGVEEGVADAFEVEESAIVARLCLQLALHFACEGTCAVFVGVGQRAHFPLFRFDGEEGVAVFRGDGGFAGESFEVVDAPAEVDASHAFQNECEARAGFCGGEGECFQLLRSIKRADGTPVKTDDGIVVSRCVEHCAGGDVGKGGGVEHRSPAHVEFLKRERRLGDERGVDARFKRHMLRQFHLRDGNDGHRRFGDGGKFRLSVVLERVAQEIVFRCGETVFIDGSIVVVGGDVRPESGAVSARPVSEGSSAVSHVEREGDASREHLADAFHHLSCGSCLVV